MLLYIMRHGQTNWNAKGITQGRSKNRLSKMGVQEVEKVANSFKSGAVDMIISSPVMRTMQTSNILNKVLGVKIIRDERLTERDKGILAGRKRGTLTEEEKRLKIENSQLLGVEPYEDVWQRVCDFYNFLKNNFKNETVLVVTHNVVAMMLEEVVKNGKKFRNLDFKDEERYYKNSEIRKFCV